DLLRGRQCPIRRHVQERMQLAIGLRDAVQMSLRNLDGAHLARGDEARNVGRGTADDVAGGAHPSSSKIRGTRKRPSSVSGAAASTSSRDRQGCSASGRKPLVIGTAWLVGGISAISSGVPASATRAT